MSIQPQFENYRYVGEICRLKGQSIVECRLPGSEISSILAVYAKATPAECVCADGEAQYGGKVTLCIVYEDGEKKICRAERGMEFFHKAEGSLVTPACFAKVGYTTENITSRREGSGLYLSVVVGADIEVYGSRQIDYLVGGDGLICKKEKAVLRRSICVSGEIEGEDEFDSDYVGDVLLRTENAIVNHVSAGGGQVEIEGEIVLHICVLKGDDGVCSYERLMPFRMQVPCDEAFGETTASARVCVKNARLLATTDEERGKSRMVFSYALAADCFLHGKETLSVVADAFSTEAEVKISKIKEGSRYLTKSVRWVERVNGVASLSPTIEGEYVLQAAVMPRAEIICRKGESGLEAEGVILAEAIFQGEDGGRKSATLSLPVLFPIDGDEEFAETEALVCGLNIRRKKNGETEAEATLKLSVRKYAEEEFVYACEVEEGERFAEEESAFSVFLPTAGEELWSVAKRLRCSPEDLQKNNPELQFPLKSGERIFVYRQIK